MQRIALAKAKPGMVLAQAVRKPDGPFLIGEGQRLTAAVIDRIRQEGVWAVWVEGNPLGADGDISTMESLVRNLPFLFRRNTDDVFMMTLSSVIAAHFARRITARRSEEEAAIAAAAAAAGETGGENG